MHVREVALAVTTTLALMLVAAPVVAAQESATEAERKSDAVPMSAPAARTCTEHCLEDGYAWAKANDISEAADCDPSPDDFGLGCRNYILENMPALPAEGAQAEDSKDALQSGDAAEEVGSLQVGQSDQQTGSAQP